ncbi:MAG: AraC family transcriptional regulator [Clostridiales bacterium]|nr:AraC family transcriptional regulator [Clostridiales bacterium]
MKNFFSDINIHTITDANINFYTVPFIHPTRKMHEHDFIYLLHGEWSLGQNGQTYDLCEDSLLILFAGNNHYGVTPCRAGTKTMYFHVTCEDGDVFEEDDSLSCIDTLINASHNKNIKKLFSEVVNAKLSGEQRKANLYFELLLCELTSQKTYLKEIKVAQKIQSIIHEYPERFFGNEELAHMMNVSVKTAENKFKAAFGKTIHQYILDFKIREAMAYFDRFEDISVKEVAYNLGFCDEYHFSKQFQKHTGMSPSKYKRSKD